jgi:hypothetical protein
MTYRQLTKWPELSRGGYLRRFFCLSCLYWVVYMSALFFAVCLGRSASDDILILGGSSVYVLCIAGVALLFRTSSAVNFGVIAMLTSAGFRVLALLPHYAQTSPEAIFENAAMHFCFALIAALTAFVATSFLFRDEVDKGPGSRVKKAS